MRIAPVARLHLATILRSVAITSATIAIAAPVMQTRRTAITATPRGAAAKTGSKTARHPLLRQQATVLTAEQQLAAIPAVPMQSAARLVAVQTQMLPTTQRSRHVALLAKLQPDRRPELQPEHPRPADHPHPADHRQLPALRPANRLLKNRHLLRITARTRNLLKLRQTGSPTEAQSSRRPDMWHLVQIPDLAGSRLCSR